MGLTDDAIKNYKKSIEIDPGIEDPYLNLANIYYHLGKISESEKAFRKLKEINPEKYHMVKLEEIIFDRFNK